MEDVLHGFLQDEGCAPVWMEEDGEYPEELNWTYEVIATTTPDTIYPHYNGEGPLFEDVR